MSIVIERVTTDQTEEQVPADGLFQVWINLTFEPDRPADWWWNSPPQSLQGALAESSEVRAGGWITKVMPEGQNPRPDGRWDNP